MAEKLVVLASAIVIYILAKSDPLGELRRINNWKDTAPNYGTLGAYVLIIIASVTILALPSRVRSHQNRLSILMVSIIAFGLLQSFYDIEAGITAAAIFVGIALAKFLYWKELLDAILIAIFLYCIPPTGSEMQFISIGILAFLANYKYFGKIAAIILSAVCFILAPAPLPVIFSFLACTAAILARKIPKIWRVVSYIPLLSAGILLSVNFTENIKFTGAIGSILIFCAAISALIRTWFFAIDREINDSGKMLEFRAETLFPHGACVLLLSLPDVSPVTVLIFAMISTKSQFCKRMT
ncbi:hypothetical protein [Tropheryma whipplei]|uniref:hypothetical protein n=1 Tax=Tropheryma whipplei TaxID=2039 RepID=UPI001E474DB3|nr:hypothetical protein [Tropheryma whipplei]